jgi:hypothetical protein
MDQDILHTQTIRGHDFIARRILIDAEISRSYASMHLKKPSGLRRRFNYVQPYFVFSRAYLF